MATNPTTADVTRTAIPKAQDAGIFDGVRAAWQVSVKNFIRPLASQKIAVAMFALSIFLILAGTLAQVEKNMWEVLERRTRSE